jgi:hypothetical protein
MDRIEKLRLSLIEFKLSPEVLELPERPGELILILSGDVPNPHDIQKINKIVADIEPNVARILLDIPSE